MKKFLFGLFFVILLAGCGSGGGSGSASNLNIAPDNNIVNTEAVPSSFPVITDTGGSGTGTGGSTTTTPDSGSGTGTGTVGGQFVHHAEPNTMALLGMGLAGLAARVLKKRKNNKS